MLNRRSKPPHVQPSLRQRPILRIFRTGLYTSALWLSLLVVAGTRPATAWEGARLLRIDPPRRPAAQRNVQVPILAYDPASPTVDRDGRVWVAEVNGAIRVLLPYGGEIASWRIRSGVEAQTLPADNGTRLVLSRDGELLRLDPAAPSTAVTLAEGLPVGFGRGCRLGAQFIWTDAMGGAVVTTGDGRVLQRVADVLFARKRYRGGAFASCGSRDALIGVAGGKLAEFAIDGLRNAEVPAALEGATFAPHTARLDADDGRVAFCSREHGCFIARHLEPVPFSERSSHDGPAILDDGRFVVAHSDGHITLYDNNGRQLRDALVGVAGPVALLRDGVAAAATPGGAIWLTTSAGDLLRISGFLNDAKMRTDRVLSIPSGVSASGLVLADGTALVRSNFGALHVMELR